MNPLLRKAAAEATESLLERSTEIERKKQGKVILTKAFLFFGIIDIILFMIVSIIVSLKDTPLFAACLALLCLPGLIMVLEYLNCRIYYDEKGFTSKNIFGVKRKFLYSEITGIKKNVGDTYIYVGEKKIIIENYAVGVKEFVDFAEEKYYEIYQKNIPEELADKNDIFKGNVKNTEIFKTLLVIMYAVDVFLFIFFAVLLFGDAVDSSANHEVAFVSCSVVRENLEMKSIDGKRFIINSIPKDYNIDKIKILCDGKTSLEISAVKQTETVYCVKAISKDNEVILSREEVKEFNRKDNILLMVIVPGGFFAFITIFALLVIFVGRNAQKYPKLAEFMFKNSHIILYNKPKKKKKRKRKT